MCDDEDNELDRSEGARASRYASLVAKAHVHKTMGECVTAMELKLHSERLAQALAFIRNGRLSQAESLIEKVRAALDLESRKADPWPTPRNGSHKG